MDPGPTVTVPAYSLPLSYSYMPGTRKNRAASKLGRLGAQARNQALSARQRSAIARKAGLAGGRGRPRSKAA